MHMLVLSFPMGEVEAMAVRCVLRGFGKKSHDFLQTQSDVFALVFSALLIIISTLLSQPARRDIGESD